MTPERVLRVNKGDIQVVIGPFRFEDTLEARRRELTEFDPDIHISIELHDPQTHTAVGIAETLRTLGISNVEFGHFLIDSNRNSSRSAPS